MEKKNLKKAGSRKTSQSPAAARHSSNGPNSSKAGTTIRRRRKSTSVSPGPPSKPKSKSKSKSKSPGPKPVKSDVDESSSKASHQSTVSNNNNTTSVSTSTTDDEISKNKSGSKPKRKSRSKLASTNVNASTNLTDSSTQVDNVSSLRDSVLSYATNTANDDLSTSKKTIPPSKETTSPAPVKKLPSAKLTTANPNVNNTSAATTAGIIPKPSTLTTAGTQTQQRKPSFVDNNGINLTLANAKASLRPLLSRRSIAIAPPNLSQFRNKVMQAVAAHKIFSLSSNFPSQIRTSLVARGWVEKPHQGLLNVKTVIGSHLYYDVDFRGNDEEKDDAWCARVLDKYPSDFIWVIRRDNIEWKAMFKDQMINRFPKANFTTKVGITSCLQTMHWFTEPGLADTFFPRCYRLSIEEEKLGFIDDFRLTACISVLKWLASSYERLGEYGVYDPKSTITALCVDFAVRQVNNYIRTRRHEDVDWIMPPSFNSQHWETFLKQYYALVHKKEKLGKSDDMDDSGIWGKYDLARKSLAKIKPYWPQYDVDGYNNIWICKPGARSRGKGIVVMDELDKILDLISSGNQREANWVVQKYIEKPLLIYKTKFDLRQWFVVTDWSPITIWFYKESYIRFCTKPFTLEDYHESVHLCNNAIQANYKNAPDRDSKLPDENMWDNYTFQSFLKTIGKLEKWNTVIYPGMKESIVGVMLASQEQVEQRKNCFELYGADFMLDNDLKPWLIEINSCPCMSNTTSVTARMCGQCLDDLIKVVVDRKENKNCDTGAFELIYRQNPTNLNVQQFGSFDLVVQGKKLPKDVDWPGIMTKYNSKRLPPSVVKKPITAVGTGLTFMDLVKKLRLKEESDGSTTPHSSNTMTPVQPGTTSNSTADSNTTDSEASTKTKNNKSDKPGTALLNFKGFPSSKAPVLETNYNDLNPLYSQISNRAQYYNINGGKANASASKKTAFNNVWNTQHLHDTRPRGLLTDMSMIIRNPSPAAPTMADLIRMTEAHELAISKLNKNGNKSKHLTKPSTGLDILSSSPYQAILETSQKQKRKSKSKANNPNQNTTFHLEAHSNANSDILNENLKEAIEAIRRTSKKSKKGRKNDTNPGL